MTKNRGKAPLSLKEVIHVQINVVRISENFTILSFKMFQCHQYTNNQYLGAATPFAISQATKTSICAVSR